MKTIATFLLALTLLTGSSLQAQSGSPDNGELRNVRAHWLSLTGGVGMLRGFGLTVGADFFVQRRDIVLGTRFVYYHVTGAYNHVVDGPRITPRDYNVEIAALIGGNINSSHSGHTSFSLGPCFSLCTLQEQGADQAYYSRFGFTVDLSHQFSNPMLHGMSGPGIRLIFSHNSAVSFFTVQLMLRFGRFENVEY
jgi:hypothetical protein